MGMVVKLILAGFWLVLVPAIARSRYRKKTNRFFRNISERISGAFYCNGNPYFAYDSYEMPLHVLTAAWGGIGIVLAVFGLFALRKRKASFLSAWKEKNVRPFISVLPYYLFSFR